VKSYDGCPPSAVYEMADENMNAKRIFEIYYNWTASHQRVHDGLGYLMLIAVLMDACLQLLVFKPKRIEKIPQKSNLMLEKEQANSIRIRRWAFVLV